MLGGLEEEAESAEVVTSAGEEFRKAVSDALHEQVTLRVGKDGDQERHSVVDWAFKFAAAGPWAQIRSYLVWCRKPAADSPAVSLAVRAELFSQLRQARLAGLGHRKFASLCVLYGIGAPQRAGGRRVVELTPEFIADVRPGQVLKDGLTG
jgi:hypothetical protein